MSNDSDHGIQRAIVHNVQDLAAIIQDPDLYVFRHINALEDL